MGGDLTELIREAGGRLFAWPIPLAVLLDPKRTWLNTSGPAVMLFRTAGRIVARHPDGAEEVLYDSGAADAGERVLTVAVGARADDRQTLGEIVDVFHGEYVTVTEGD